MGGCGPSPTPPAQHQTSSGVQTAQHPVTAASKSSPQKPILAAPDKANNLKKKKVVFDEKQDCFDAMGQHYMAQLRQQKTAEESEVHQRARQKRRKAEEKRNTVPPDLPQPKDLPPYDLPPDPPPPV